MRKSEEPSKMKTNYVKAIFESIAPHYDIMNRIISWGLDKSWRKRAVDLLAVEAESKILDVACGTCVLTIMLAEQLNEKGQVAGVDCSSQMLKTGAEKVKKKRLSRKVKLIQGDARKLPFLANQFDYVGITFALRNISEREQVLREMKRVVKPGGTMFTLDIFKPTMIGYQQLFLFYFNKIVPGLGKVMFDQYQEYNWLPKSLESFITIEELKLKLKQLGLKKVKTQKMMGGAIAIHYGKK